MDKVDPNVVREFYNKHDQMWEINNWYKYSQSTIVSFLQKQKYTGNILNAGSGGNSYGIASPMVHLDISEEKIKAIDGAVVGNLEISELFQTDNFDSIICVGSVINYCNSYKVVENFQKWLREDGILILEFENSSSFEYLFTSSYNKPMAIISTNYIDSNHVIYTYSLDYLISLLRLNNFEIIEITSFHTLSSLVLRFFKSENFASKFTFLDIFLNMKRQHFSEQFL
ncbi:hypothetical protein BI362_08570 [Streptococcus parauberis]|uniref:hypothetical protein n=1 Tax=Streptococcus parauberis TaxID=1348 RepID=UPI0008FAC45D|nr:hypothetical protein [Streptococcus parauberis]OHY29478.1 hypothetical protein BI362_08570 [Streptococcus parauberis]PIA86433.1 hypothetical protein ADO07_00128 [Streptococcus parauberis]POS68452.1 hypothetical protein AOS90_00027 [Streptococcus parauberis]